MTSQKRLLAKRKRREKRKTRERLRADDIVTIWFNDDQLRKIFSPSHLRAMKAVSMVERGQLTLVPASAENILPNVAKCLAAPLAEDAA